MGLHAIIRELECIGCTKCIQACPVDAILGAAKQMHTVISTECTGCELCVSPCPVDCIEMVKSEIEFNQDIANKRMDDRQKRLAKKSIEIAQAKKLSERKAYVEAAIKRVRKKTLPVNYG